MPPEVFTTPYTNPVSGNPETVRANLREAMRLLQEAGYEVRNQQAGQRQDRRAAHASSSCSTTRPSSASSCSTSPRSSGSASTRHDAQVDDAQYENRLRSWDFDMIIAQLAESLSPGNEQREYWGSAAADQAARSNYVGIKNPAVDALIERVIFAKDRDELVAATKALDRVLLWNHYVVPQWTYGKVRTARWDRFGHPEAMPKYGACRLSRRSGGGTRRRPPRRRPLQP